jgi:hypothetical protein
MKINPNGTPTEAQALLEIPSSFAAMMFGIFPGSSMQALHWKINFDILY